MSCCCCPVEHGTPITRIYCYECALKERWRAELCETLAGAEEGVQVGCGDKVGDDVQEELGGEGI